MAIGNSPSSRAQRQPRSRRLKTGIFLLNEEDQSQVQWQLVEPSVSDSDALLHKVAFRCFLCDETLNTNLGHPKQDTHEDIFPQWLQKRFDLADLPIALSDGRQKKYSEALIPACQACNNVHMSRIEDRIVRTTQAGFDAFKHLPKHIVFLWCAKIYYGIMHLEVQPRDPRTKVPEPPALAPQFLKDAEWILVLLQGFRKRVLISGYPSFPFSVIRLPLQTGKDVASYFNVRWPTTLPGIALQLGRVGVICVFDDFGFAEEWYSHHFESLLSGRELHPNQFWEVAGRLFYAASLQSAHTWFLRVEDAANIWIEYDPHPEPQKEFRPAEADSWTRQFTKAPEGMRFWNPNTQKMITLLERPDGSFNEMLLDPEDP